MLRVEQISSKFPFSEAKNSMESANHGRDYDTYTAKMDAAVEAKVASLFSRFNIFFDGMVLVDAGSGTGLIAERIAQECESIGVSPQVFAIDISHAYSEFFSQQQSITTLFGDAAEQLFPDDSVAIKYYSTSGHEIASFGGGASRMVTAIQNSFLELQPGGQLLIRDFVKPENTGSILMELSETNGINQNQISLDTTIEHQSLSTLALFKQFHREFAGGNAFAFEEITIDGKTLIVLEPEWAYEFYMRKEYTNNWKNEIHEKYSYWTLAEAKDILEVAGFENVQVEPDPNQYMLSNWLEGQVNLYQQNQAGTLELLPFPATHMVISGNKPLR